jgi:hypothetical protein
MTYKAVKSRVIGRRLHEAPNPGLIYVPLEARSQLNLMKVLSVGEDVTQVSPGETACFPPDSFYLLDPEKDIISVLEEDIEFTYQETSDEA